MLSIDFSELRREAYSEFESANYGRSAELLEQLSEIIGDDAKLLNDMAVALFKSGRTSEALSRFRQAFEVQARTSFLISDNLTEVLNELLSGDKKNIDDSSHLSNTYCPVCKSANKGFKPIPEFYLRNFEIYGFEHFEKGEMTPRESYLCSVCGASDRERLYAHWILMMLVRGEIDKRINIMHFAPESGLSGWIKSLGFENYATSDYTMSGVDYHSDLMDLPFDDNSIDFFICSHVLEHVEDDRAALQELFRVTRRGGLGILMVPIVSGLEAIDEDPCESDVAERWRRFGQDDHVRLYNRVGFLERICEAGFKVKTLDVSYFGLATFESLGLKSESVLYIVNR